MGLQVRKGGVWQTITGLKIFSGGSWRNIIAVKIYKSGAWQTVANFTPPAPSGGGGGGGAISLSVSPNPCAGTSTTSTVTTPFCTVTPSGGQTPYTYAWSMQSGLATINNPASAFTTFTRSGVTLGSTVGAVAKCDVTDSLGVHASITVNLSFSHEQADNSGTQ